MSHDQSKQIEQVTSQPAAADDWQPIYSKWRHGGWYVHNVRYDSGACGCVSNNYVDKKWRIVCDPRRSRLNEEGDFTFKTRDAAARAELQLTIDLREAAAKQRVEDQNGSSADFDSMSESELVAWYVQSVGYNPLEDDPQTTEEGLRALCKELAAADAGQARQVAAAKMPVGYLLNDFEDGSYGWELENEEVFEDGFSSPDAALAAALEHCKEQSSAQPTAS